MGPKGTGDVVLFFLVISWSEKDSWQLPKKYPGKNIEGIKWDKYHSEEDRKKKRQQAEVWNEDDIPKSIRNEL